ncbi:MAG: 2-hydroxyacyl-CoA dehydratase [Planctomycetota bacterium]|jgi:benzoyl-CoA reductase/2-hydroxyglutaryl-CoA dehydratase subunit BcrC/BadD/HgdB
MTVEPKQITLAEWDEHYELLQEAGMAEPAYGGRLSRHVDDGDHRLTKLRYDNSQAALRLWNFLLTENDRLRAKQQNGTKIVGTMKDLGTVPVMAYSLDNVAAFYPDGAWWIPCVMERSAHLLHIADSLGIDESFCPVRAMLGAFTIGGHFPIPDLLTCSVGATCDDFSTIAQRLEALGHPILWWEIPHRRPPEPNEEAVQLPGNFSAPDSQVDFVKGELHRIKAALENLAGQKLDEQRLFQGIRKANMVRKCLAELRDAVFCAEVCPMPALEMLIAEMLAIHFCSDREETICVLKDLLLEVKRRTDANKGILDTGAAKIFWVNPVADLRMMNLLEETGSRVCGTEFMFSHALDLIPEDRPPMEALAQIALADPMAGSSIDRAKRIYTDICKYDCEALLISRIPGASHCAMEGKIIGQYIRSRLDIPVIEIEVPPLTDAIQPVIRTRLDAMGETVKQRRNR